MTDEISALSDSTAIRVLSQMPDVWPSENEPSPTLSPEEKQALLNWLGQPPGTIPPKEGELARETLSLLALEPDRKDTILALAGETPERGDHFDAGLTLAVGTLALVFLQTQVHFERDKDGKWSIEIKKPTMKDSLLKPFVAKLMALLD